MCTESMWVDGCFVSKSPTVDTPPCPRGDLAPLAVGHCRQDPLVGHELSQWIMLGSRKKKNIGEQSSP